MSGRPEPFLIDDGYFKGTFSQHNFDKLAQWDGTNMEVRGILICAGSGLWLEPDIGDWIDACEKRGYAWGTWFFMYRHLGESAQFSKWSKVPVSPYFPTFVDYEFSLKYQTIPSATQLRTMWHLFEQKEQRPAGCYSRKQLIDAYLNTLSASELNGRKWWLAQYGADRSKEDLRAIILPDGMKAENILIHQTADKGAPPSGYTPNARAQDWDRWISEDPFPGQGQPIPTVPPTTPLTVDQRVALLEREAKSHGWNLS